MSPQLFGEAIEELIGPVVTRQIEVVDFELSYCISEKNLKY